MSKQHYINHRMLSLFAIIMLVGCGSYPPPSIPSTVIVEVTAPPVLTTIEVKWEVDATRIVEITRSVLVTPTPSPLLAEDCHQKAMTTSEMNACALLEYELSLAEMDSIVSEIKGEMTPEEQILFDELQKGWLAQIERDCEFFFGQVEKLDNGMLYYKWGSMAPGRVASCEAGKAKDRTLELRQIYLCSDFRCGDN